MQRAVEAAVVSCLCNQHTDQVDRVKREWVARLLEEIRERQKAQEDDDDDDDDPSPPMSTTGYCPSAAGSDRASFDDLESRSNDFPASQSQLTRTESPPPPPIHPPYSPSFTHTNSPVPVTQDTYSSSFTPINSPPTFRPIQPRPPPPHSPHTPSHLRSDSNGWAPSPLSPHTTPSHFRSDSNGWAPSPLSPHTTPSHLRSSSNGWAPTPPSPLSPHYTTMFHSNNSSPLHYRAPPRHHPQASIMEPSFFVAPTFGNGNWNWNTSSLPPPFIYPVGRLPLPAINPVSPVSPLGPEGAPSSFESALRARGAADHASRLRLPLLQGPRDYVPQLTEHRPWQPRGSFAPAVAEASRWNASLASGTAVAGPSRWNDASQARGTAGTAETSRWQWQTPQSPDSMSEAMELDP
jgi:hypothetical protein